MSLAGVETLATPRPALGLERAAGSMNRFARLPAASCGARAVTPVSRERGKQNDS
jgi:hypothetical protein